MSGPVAPAELLERDDELDRLRQLTADAACGRGAAMVLEGPAGIGKTSLAAGGGASRRSSPTGGPGRPRRRAGARLRLRRGASVAGATRRPGLPPAARALAGGSGGTCWAGARAGERAARGRRPDRHRAARPLLADGEPGRRGATAGRGRRSALGRQRIAALPRLSRPSRRGAPDPVARRQPPADRIGCAGADRGVRRRPERVARRAGPAQRQRRPATSSHDAVAASSPSRSTPPPAATRSSSARCWTWWTSASWPTTCLSSAPGR